MRAMLLERLGPLAENPRPLRLGTVPDPVPAAGEVLIRVDVCGVCHTELDEIEGRLPPPRLPVVPGHQAVGRVAAAGEGARLHRVGDRVGVAWIFSACGACRHCREGRENLCEQFRGTGRDADGGYAELMTVPEGFAVPIPAGLADEAAAPMLCAGAIGYRSLRLAGLEGGRSLGLAGFGASGHLVLKLVRRRLPDVGVFVFARSERERAFALELGADWAGGHDEPSPRKLDAIIDTTPAWSPILRALENLDRGGRLVINAIRKEPDDIEALLRLDYPRHLWLEKEIKSVANVTRADVAEFLALAAAIPLRPEVRLYPLEQANEALVDLRRGDVRGSKVLRID